MRRTVIGSLVGAIAALAIGATPAVAASGYTLYGDATLTGGHNSPTGVQLTSVDFSSFSGIDFAVPSGMTFGQLNALGTDYMFTDNSCGGGSPRFQVNVDSAGTTKNIFVYIGPVPNFTGCDKQTWVVTGNLTSSPDAIVDTSQLAPGSYQTYSAAQSEFGSLSVTGIQLVVDSGWMFASGDDTQTAVVDNVNINGTIYTFESAATCKDSGWQAYGTFKNQGDCVSFYATQKNS